MVSKDSTYIGVFFPGGHAALINLPESEEIKDVLHWAVKNNKKVITLCHRPAALIAASINEYEYLFAGYEIAVFPDSLDEGLIKIWVICSEN